MGFVVLMGMGTVFFGLICIILLTTLMGKIMGVSKAAPAAAKPVAAAPAAPAPAKVEAIQPEVLAAITAALEGEVGAAAQREAIVSIRKL